MFKFRSTEKELLDADYIPEEDLYLNLRELDFINNWLGGYSISFSALKKVLIKNKTFNLVDIGSGGGDTLKKISTWQKRNGFQLNLYGVDIKPVCIVYAQTNTPSPDIHFICDDYRNVFRHIARLDIIHASLFCHHLSAEEIIDLIGFARLHGAVLVINDLERNGLAYYLIKLLTRLFSRSYLVKNDAPVSVTRGFRKIEWIAMIEKAGAVKYSVKNRWAFRHEVIIYPGVDP